MPNIVVIIAEQGLRYKKELLPMKKDQVDLENGVVHIADSKTVNGIGDTPLTAAAKEASNRGNAGERVSVSKPEGKGSEALNDQPAQSLGGDAEEGRGAVLRPLELRQTFATGLSAGGVADHMVTQMLRHSDAGVFKRYNQAKLGMMHEALAKLDRHANERGVSSTKRG